MSEKRRNAVLAKRAEWALDEMVSRLEALEREGFGLHNLAAALSELDVEKADRIIGRSYVAFLDFFEEADALASSARNLRRAASELKVMGEALQGLGKEGAQ